MTQQQATQRKPITRSTGDTSNDAESAKTNLSTCFTLLLENLFNKPPKWSLGLLKFLIIILLPLLSDAPDIQLNFYIINIMI